MARIIPIAPNFVHLCSPMYFSALKLNIKLCFYCRSETVVKLSEVLRRNLPEIGRNIADFLARSLADFLARDAADTRCAVVKNSDAAANNRATVFRRRIQNGETRRKIIAPRYAVAVKSKAEIQRNFRVNRPAILHETGGFLICVTERQTALKINPLR